MCRVKYGEESLRRIVNAVQKNQLSVPEKSSLLADTLSFMKSGTVPHEYVIQMLNSFKNEDKSETVDMILVTVGN